jgi:hypothetical protein
MDHRRQKMLRLNERGAAVRRGEAAADQGNSIMSIMVHQVQRWAAARMHSFTEESWQISLLVGMVFPWKEHRDSG